MTFYGQEWNAFVLNEKIEQNSSQGILMSFRNSIVLATSFLSLILALFMGSNLLQGNTILNSKICNHETPAKFITKFIANDFRVLQSRKLLHEKWYDIAYFDLKMRSQLASILFGSEQLNFPTTSQGTTRLEVEIIDLPDELNPGIIVQASLFDIRTRNKIFEIGRTYTMNDFNRTDD